MLNHGLTRPAQRPENANGGRERSGLRPWSRVPRPGMALRSWTTAGKSLSRRTRCSRPFPMTGSGRVYPSRPAITRALPTIEKLVDSPLSEFTGRCVRKGKALSSCSLTCRSSSAGCSFPPHARNGVQRGRLRSLCHPAPPDSRRQAAGQDSLRSWATTRPRASKTSTAWPSTTWHPSLGQHRAQKDLETAAWPSAGRWKIERRRDLTALEFISIDAAKTQDIDDALYAEVSSDGWNLYVAIADPTAYIHPGFAACTGTSPPAALRSISTATCCRCCRRQLSQDTCALSEGNGPRLRWCASIAVSDGGEVGEFRNSIEATDTLAGEAVLLCGRSLSQRPWRMS